VAWPVDDERHGTDSDAARLTPSLAALLTSHTTQSITHSHWTLQRLALLLLLLL